MISHNTTFKNFIVAVFMGAFLIVVARSISSLVFLNTVPYENVAAVAAIVPSPFNYLFSVNGVLNEVGDMNSSGSGYFWVNSGGQLILKDGIGMTMQGEATTSSKWRGLYAVANPIDTDAGAHPQNLFRLITRSMWGNVRQQAYFYIQQYNVSVSPNRSESNGLLLFSRYKDSANLYYAGVRVDGNAIIKKKINGTYYTLASKRWASGTYDRVSSPNLLPIQTWIGVRSEVTTLADGKISIKLYVDNGKTGNWTLAAEAIDDGKSYGGSGITDKQYAGIRTDFMDVKFDDYSLEELK